MGHIKYRSTTRAEATPVAWLGVGAQIGELANMWAAREDLIAYIGPGAGGVAPACYTPATAEVEVNVDVAFGSNATPEDIGDLRERENQFMWPKAAGAIFHEALHARFSSWDMEAAFKDLEPAEFRALILLEEGRIEGNGTRLYPENKGFLRSCALEIVIADLAEQPIADSDSRVAAQIAALTMARVDAGVLDESDVMMLTDIIVKKLGAERVRLLRDLWLAAQAYDRHTDISGLYDVAREWVRIVEEAAKENGEPEDSSAGDEAGMGTPSSSGSGSSSEFTESIMEALSEAAENATIGSFEQLNEQQTSEEWQDIAKDRSSAAKQEQEHKSIADDVFGRGTGPMPDTATRSMLREKRQPTAAERAAAVKVANMLEKAKYRDRDETEIHSIVPPGRLRTRAMVQGAALKTKGVMTQVEPWRRTVRKHVDDPTLTIGVMVDISGSMSEAMEPMATTAWVMSEAVRRVQGRSAMIYYGQDVFPTLKPGQHLKEVNVYTAPDGTEKFDKAFKALDGSLNLLNGTGARLLVVVSDGCYVHKEELAARKWIAACQRAGVGVLWMPFDGRDNGRTAVRLTAGTSTVVLTGMTDPAGAATEIGTAAARALTTAS
jgi:hypothetical protein